MVSRLFTDYGERHVCIHVWGQSSYGWLMFIYDTSTYKFISVLILDIVHKYLSIVKPDLRLKKSGYLLLQVASGIFRCQFPVRGESQKHLQASLCLSKNDTCK